MNAKTVTVAVPAKINLSLLITGTDGEYHTLDSAVCSVRLYDIVCVTNRPDNAVSFCCPEYSLSEDNTAVRAARAFMAAYGCPGVDIRVEKGIPVEAGLGGSSADAAGVFNAMAELFGARDSKSLSAIAASIGSDVPYMLRGGFARLTGRGEIVRPFTCPRPLYFVLAKPASGVSTEQAYRAFDENPASSGGDNAALVSALKRGELPEPELFQNDLYAPAARLNPEVARIRRTARKTGAHAAFMTGSGSAVAALYSAEEEAERGRTQLAEDSAYSVKVRTV